MSDQSRSGVAWVSWLLVLVGVLCLVAGIIYLSRPASSLPGFFPGHDVSLHRKHARSGIGAIRVGCDRIRRGVVGVTQTLVTVLRGRVISWKR